MKEIVRMTMVAVLIICLAVPMAVAADFPERPVTIIIPVAAGGARDIQCRAFAATAEKLWGKPVVPVNKPGAAGMLGMTAGAQAAPDGYTLTGTSTADMASLEWELSNKRNPNVSRKDFVYLGMLTYFPHVVVVPYDSPWQSIADLIAAAKAKPGFYSFASAGLNGGTHLAVEYIMDATGTKFRHVPFNGGGPAVTAIVGKHVDFGIMTSSACMPLIKGQKIRALAVASENRYGALPDVATLYELGIRDCEINGWVGLFAPLKTPRPIVDKLRESVKKVCEQESFIKIIEGSGDKVTYRNADEMAKYLDYESAKYSKFYERVVAEQKEKK